MYDLNDTIVAVSSPTPAKRVIIRITGPDTIKTINEIFSPPPKTDSSASSSLSAINAKAPGARLLTGTVAVSDRLRIDAQLYLFLGPHSYTGDDVAEIHLYTNSSTTEAFLGNLLRAGLRPAGPGEFTARSFLNGKINLAQAEAVNEAVLSSNTYQLSAAEKLLTGELGQKLAKVKTALMDGLSLIEVRLDFSDEDIESISQHQTIERLSMITDELEQLLSDSIRYESVIDMPAVGIAGAPNAGKSSLLNRLLGQNRSITSPRRKTTRDVLTGILTLPHSRCVLFDCAGLLPEPENILDEWTQQAAIEALKNSTAVVFCVDITRTDWTKDLSIRQLVGQKDTIFIATKSDSLPGELLHNRVSQLNEIFAAPAQSNGFAGFLPTSAKTGQGLELLTEAIDKKLLSGSAPHAVYLTTRLRSAVEQAARNVNDAVIELQAGNDEVAAMLLQAAYRGLCDTDRPIDEQLLERIFSQFCIGK